MDQERERIQADLRGLLEGEVRCDDLFLQLYASDASLYEIRPLAVVRPRGARDVSACVQYAAENGLPIHARGAGTGLAGESLGRGVVVDFSHSMRRVLDISGDTARVQPGVVLSQLNRQLASTGRQFGPDPSTRSVTSLGSVLAIDGAGSHWLKYGSARQHVVSMQVVLADGQIVEVNRHSVGDNGGGRHGAAMTVGDAIAHGSLPSRGDNSASLITSRAPLGLAESADAALRSAEAPPEGQRLPRLVRELAGLIERNRAVIDGRQPKSLVNRAGYRLHDVLENGQLDLAKMLVGSEGTLALITEATVRIEPAPRSRGVALLFFDRLENAARGALEATAMEAAACDLMDRRLLSIAREADVRYDLLIPREAEAMLLVEAQGDDSAEVRDRLQQIVGRLQRRKRLAFDSRTTMDREERDLYWRLARRVTPTLYRLRGATRPVPFVEDMAVPPAELPEFLLRVQNILKSHQVTASLFCHAGHGQLHLRPFLDLNDFRDVQKMQSLASDLYEQVLEFGGTISGEHGDGLSRTWYLRRQYGPLYDVFREVKRLFDPQNVLNPGKVVAESPQPLTHNLRRVRSGQALAPEDAASGDPQTASLVAGQNGAGEASPSAPVDLMLHWAPQEFAETVRNCNGCGRCRTQSPPERMCPIFRLAPAEEASPRAKANLMRALWTGQLPADQLGGDELKAIADLCVHCHQCRLECPAGVDIPKLMVECKAQYASVNGLRVEDWFLTRLDLVSSLAAKVRPLANWALGNRFCRWMLEKTFGIAQGRKLPRLARRSFLRRAAKRRLTRSSRGAGRKVLYFVDLYANWFDAQLAEAFVAVLEHNGVSVFVHPAQKPSGMAHVVLGAVDEAKRLATRNVAILGEAVRQGYQIVATEPSAALCLAHEYPNLLDDEEARLVAANTSEACAYLWKMHQQGKLELDLEPLNLTVAYHMPCHVQALGAGPAGENLLRLIPGVTVQRLEKGCSGMAGVYGLKRENYRSSLRAGWGLISALRDPALQVGVTECSSCKMQMEQGSSKPTLHPIKLLALAYGLAPDVRELLTARGKELTTT